MYKVSSKLNLFAIILMVAGVVATAFGFMSAPGSEDDVKEMLANEAAHHGDDHSATADTHQVAGHDAHATGHDEAGEHHGDDHIYHLYHQLSNRPWAALYVACFFFFMIGLGVLAFYAVQRAAQAGWSPGLFRVMEGISSYILPGGILMFVLLLVSGLHVNHIFVWMDPDIYFPFMSESGELLTEFQAGASKNPKYDYLVAGKQGFLNVPFWLFRAGAFLVGWNLYRWNVRKFSLKQDESPEGNVWYKKAFKHSAAFLVFFIVTESIMSWDWIMSFDPHWFSTLFGWYVFASMFVSGITVIALVTIYLKGKGELEWINDSHIHDLAKFMFGVSIFWTYLWFSQFMLIWYSNIPEEVTYFVTRIEDYNLLFFGMVAINFLFPLLVLMNSDFKRINWFVITAGLFILVGHYLDIYVMIMPATVGVSWSFGLEELGPVMFFAGLFLFWVFRTISQAPLLPKGDPFIGESKNFHY